MENIENRIENLLILLLEKKDQQYSLKSIRSSFELYTINRKTAQQLNDIINSVIESKKLSEALLENGLVEEEYIVKLSVSPSSTKLKSITKG